MGGIVMEESPSLKGMGGIVEKGKGFYVAYTSFPECRQFPGWILAPGWKLGKARAVIEREAYDYGSAFEKDRKRYLMGGIPIDIRPKDIRAAPNKKEGWFFIFNSEERDSLENLLKKLDLPLS
jgi:hypothetical protein